MDTLIQFYQNSMALYDLLGEHFLIHTPNQPFAKIYSWADGVYKANQPTFSLWHKSFKYYPVLPILKFTTHGLCFHWDNFG